MSSSKKYPVAMPYRPAQAPVASPSPSRSRGWSVLLLGISASSVLLLAIVLGLTIHPGLLSSSTPPGEPPGWVGEPERYAGPSKKSRTTTSPAKKSAAPESSAEDAHPVKLELEALKTKTARQTERFLEALGGLSAAHLFQAHLNIQLLAEGVEAKVFAVAEARKKLRTVSDLLKLVETRFAQLEKEGLDPEDQTSVKRVQAVSGLLRLQSETLQEFWAAGGKEKAERYEQARKAAGTGLNKLFGLEEK